MSDIPLSEQRRLRDDAILALYGKMTAAQVAEIVNVTVDVVKSVSARSRKRGNPNVKKRNVRNHFRTRGTGDRVMRAAFDMSAHYAWGDKAADASDAMLAALQQHHEHGAGEANIVQSDHGPTRYVSRIDYSLIGSPGAMCDDA